MVRKGSMQVYTPANTQIIPLAESKAIVVVDEKKSEVPLAPEDEDLEVKLRRITELVPPKVSNTSGSSAGSGSGDFHQYRSMRRHEQDRMSRMDLEYRKRKEIAEFEARRQERLRAAEEQTNRKRAKRQKKKEKKRVQVGGSLEAGNGSAQTPLASIEEEEEEEAAPQEALD